MLSSAPKEVFKKRYENLVEEQPDVEQSGNQLDTLNMCSCKNKTQE